MGFLSADGVQASILLCDAPRDLSSLKDAGWGPSSFRPKARPFSSPLSPGKQPSFSFRRDPGKDKSAGHQGKCYDDNKSFSKEVPMAKAKKKAVKKKKKK